VVGLGAINEMMFGFVEASTGDMLISETTSAANIIAAVNIEVTRCKASTTNDGLSGVNRLVWWVGNNQSEIGLGGVRRWGGGPSG
jgi:hypothetical protein